MKFITSDIIGYKTKTNSYVGYISGSDSKHCNLTHQSVRWLSYIEDAGQYYSLTVAVSRHNSGRMPS